MQLVLIMNPEELRYENLQGTRFEGDHGNWGDNNVFA